MSYFVYQKICLIKKFIKPHIFIEIYFSSMKSINIFNCRYFYVNCRFIYDIINY